MKISPLMGSFHIFFDYFKKVSMLFLSTLHQNLLRPYFLNFDQFIVDHFFVIVLFTFWIFSKETTFLIPCHHIFYSPDSNCDHVVLHINITTLCVEHEVAKCSFSWWIWDDINKKRWWICVDINEKSSLIMVVHTRFSPCTGH